MDPVKAKEDTEGTKGDKEHSVYLWKGFSQPVSIVTFDIFASIDIIDVSVGKEHSLFLTKDGTVYSYGGNGCGQLGLGSLEVKAVADPVKLDSIKDRIIQVSCGKHHSAVVTQHGQALCWGDSRDGQCGTGSVDIVTSPSPVTQTIPSGFCKEHGHPKPPLQVLFESVACGSQHTLAVSTEGEVWAWGCGEPLGLGELLHTPVPRCIETLKGKTVLSVCCGDRHSLALVMKGNSVDKKRPSISLPPKDDDVKGEKKIVVGRSQSIGDITVDKNFPSRCNSCQKEIFTYTDVSDMCIIETDHDCNGSDDHHQHGKKTRRISGDEYDSSFVDDIALISASSPNASTSSSANVPDGKSQEQEDRKRSSTMISPKPDNTKRVKDLETKDNDTSKGDNQRNKETLLCDSPDSSSIQSPTSARSLESATSPIPSLEIENPVNDVDKGDNSNVFEENGFNDCFSGIPDTTLDCSILILPSETDELRDGNNVLPIFSGGDSRSNSNSNSSELKPSSSNEGEESLPNNAKDEDQNRSNIEDNTTKLPESLSSHSNDDNQSSTESNIHRNDGMEGTEADSAVNDEKKNDNKTNDEKDISCDELVGQSGSQDSDEDVWKRQSATDDLGCEDVLDHPLSQSCQSQFPRARSPSSCSIKSLPLLNQTEAMQYLRKQFDDDDDDGDDIDDAKGGEKRKERARTRRARSVTTKPPTNLVTVGGGGGGIEGVLSGLGFANTSSPTGLVKSITNRAMSSLQSLSVFSSTVTTTATTASPSVTSSTPTPTLSDRTSSSVEMISFVSPTSSEQDDDFGTTKNSSGVASDVVLSSPESYTMISSVSSLTNDGTMETSTSPADLSPNEVRLRAIRSGTFIEWRKEMSSVDSDHMSSLSADDNPKSLRSLRTIELKRRNLSSSSSPIASDKKTSPHPPVITTTEVWAWGRNNYGQLGLGDTIDRAEPVWLKHFSGRNVKKLAAGDYHSMALIDNSQVYSWGSNSYGQLGQSKSTDFPTRIKFQGGNAVWDIATGSQHSILLADTSFHRPDVFYCGKQPSGKVNASMKKASEPIGIPSIRENSNGWIVCLHSGGSDCACQVWNLQRPLASTVFELASTERTLYSQLIKTSNLLLRPLKKSSFFSSMDVYPYKPALQNVIATFGVLTTRVGKGITDLTATIQHRRHPKEARLVCERKDFLDAFRSYSQVFSDFLAIGGFEYCTKTGSQFFAEIQGNVQALSGEKDKSVTASSLFLRAMSYPFYRLSAYSRLFSKMAEAAQNPEDKNAFENTKLDWDSLKSLLSSEHKMADTTKAFWESTNSRLADAMRSTSRRLLKESKSHPLALVSASRFSSASFILFNDMFVYSQNNSVTSYRLETLWVETGDSQGNSQNHIIVTTPEDRLELSAPNPSVKAEWLMSLQSAISKALTNQKNMSSPHASGERFTPPLIRHAEHVFTKQCIYKDATYKGTWLSGKVHGLGEMIWPDGSVFKGSFKRGLMHGHGTYSIVKSHGKEVQKGVWKDGKLNGQASIVYANGDLYEGYLKDGYRFGHGMLQMGRIKSNCASVYIGEWSGNHRHGYGVEDHILKGEKYMGAWSEDSRHGNGIMVTLDGMYFEGTFVNNKMSGFGVMISDDDTLYEGDFMGITHLSGKGTLTLPQGDKLEGSFSGSLNEGLKVNGTFSKASTIRDSFSDHHNHPNTDRQLPSKSKYFGRICVQADAKWADIFSYVCATLGQSQGDAGVGSGGGGGGGGTTGGGRVAQRSRTDTEKAWEVVAVLVSEGLKKLKEQEGSKAKLQRSLLQSLEIIPNHRMGDLDTVTVKEIYLYLEKAFESSHHPLGQMMNMLVDVFRASYIGVGAHPRLLHHAVQEIRSYIKRVYKVLRLLFPALPESGYTTYFPPSHPVKSAAEANTFVEGLEVEDPEIHILTAAGLLYPILLPKIYPPLFDLYALYNDRSDDRYWERITKLNRQGDVGLMAYLGIEQQFWLVDEILAQDSSRTLSSIREECYAQAVDQLQQLSTAFSPLEKLTVIKEAFNEITKTVMTSLGDEIMWCMDDLFPIFQFVVVRAKIHHLGAEIHLIEDLMEQHMEHGEYGLMFTTLTACYFQIQNEKMPHH